MQAFFESGNVLRGFVSDAGNRIGVIKKFLCTIGCNAGCLGPAVGKDAYWIFRARIADMLDDLENLAFHDASHAIQKSAALAFDFAGIFRLAAQPKNDAA